ncbi:hypothetical protein ACQY0O_005436 [Thecaphora frezii]
MVGPLDATLTQRQPLPSGITSSLLLWLSLALLCLVRPSDGRNFTLTQDLSGADFFDAFHWWNYQDPTKGAVNYISKSQARAANLSFVNEKGHFVMQADSTTRVEPGDARRSVRIHSNRLMGDGILVARFAWMPQGCGTWPAFWTCTIDVWPSGGEIDIIEGANNQGPRNLASLHTRYGCHIPNGNSSQHTGVSYEADCSCQPGCSVHFQEDNTFGPGFNKNGGGWYAMRRDTRADGDGISVWFWPATTPASSLPLAVAAAADGSAPKYVMMDANATGHDRAELERWGEPAAFFPNIANATASQGALEGGVDGVCQMQDFFEEHEIIINLTFCGSWAGETFASSGCGAQYGNVSCEQFVRENPQAFADARWEIEYLRTYTDGGARLGVPALSLVVAAAALVVVGTMAA